MARCLPVPHHTRFICSVNKIMLDLKSMGFEMDFPAMKLKAASGEAVCRVLVFAADHVRTLVLRRLLHLLFILQYEYTVFTPGFSPRCCC